MIALFLACFLTFTDYPDILLDSDHYQYLQIRIQRDGSFLGYNEHTAYHWSPTGKRLVHFGEKGEGPGEFLYMTEVVFTGTHYLAIDARRYLLQVFNKDGQYLFKQPSYLQSIFKVGRYYYGLDIKAIQGGEAYPRMYREFTISVNENKKVVQFKQNGEFLKKPTVKQRTFGTYNYRDYFFVSHQGMLLLINEIEPRLWYFTEEIRKREATIPHSEPWEGKTVPVSLTIWPDVPEKFPRSREEMTKAWWYSFGRINWMSKSGKHLVIGYQAPNKEKTDFNQMVDIFELNPAEKTPTNQILKPKPVERIPIRSIRLPGAIVGTRGGYVYSWEIDENDATVIHRQPILKK